MAGPAVSQQLLRVHDLGFGNVVAGNLFNNK